MKSLGGNHNHPRLRGGSGPGGRLHVRRRRLPKKEEPTMTEATPPPEEKDKGQPRDAAYWAKRVEKLEVSEVPAGAANVNVQGRHEVGALQFISASVGGIPVYTGVRVIYADEESFTVMTPEGHPESGWNTFSAYQDEDGIAVAQVQSLARANDPIYELGFRVVGSAEQERIWTHVLKSLAAHFGVNEPVTLEKACLV